MKKKTKYNEQVTDLAVINIITIATKKMWRGGKEGRNGERKKVRHGMGKGKERKIRDNRGGVKTNYECNYKIVTMDYM